MKQHPKYEHVFVTPDGKIFSNKSGKLKELTQFEKNGYLKCTIFEDDNVISQKFVHRLVAETFIPNPNNLPEIDHIDCNKQNNLKDNLEWVTSKENKRRAWNNNLYNKNFGEDHYLTDMTDSCIRDVCQCIQDGMRNKEISEMFNIHKDLISHIKRGVAWKHISKDFNFKVKRLNRKPLKLIENICKLISEQKSDKEIFEIIDGRCSLADISRIRKKKIHCKISDKYF